MRLFLLLLGPPRLCSAVSRSKSNMRLRMATWNRWRGASAFGATNELLLNGLLAGARVCFQFWLAAQFGSQVTS